MASSSKLAVGSAIVGNALVGAMKFGAFFVTGSGAMLSEAIHSVADTLNQVLLMVGIVRSSRAADDDYHYGYHAERYVWALISAVGIFFLGCGVTTYHGIQTLLHPHTVENEAAAVVVLLVALVIEGTVLVIAWRGLRHAAAGRPFVRFLREEADPSAVAVLLEDSAACLGVLIALGCLGLVAITGDSRWDALASILIGLLLGGMAIWLVGRNQRLLIGPAVPAADHARILAVLERSPFVEEIIDLKTRMLGTEEYRVKANVVFAGEIMARELDPALKADWDRMDTFEDFRAFARRYADAVTDLLGDEIDDLERQIRVEVPKVKHIDIEAD